MSFFGNLFKHKPVTESVVLIEIGPDSIAGGLAYFKEGMPPIVVYANRMPIVPIIGTDNSVAVAKTLHMLGERIIHEGAPALARVAGSGKMHSVLISVKAPWQETTIRSEKIERTVPFTFTKSLLSLALAKSATPPPGRLLADEFVISTLLDGYEVKNPVGKRARYINISILSSFIEEKFSLTVAESLRTIFHTREIRLVAAAALRHTALRTIFPLEREYLMIDVASNSVVTALVRGGSLAVVEHATSEGATASKTEWLAILNTTFAAVTKRYPLPRKIFLIADDLNGQDFKAKIEAEPFTKYSLSQEPPLVVLVAPAQLTDHIKLGDAVAPDLGLEFMTIFWQHSEH